jgi:hypothetical protein
MSCTEDSDILAGDPLETLDDALPPLPSAAWSATCATATMPRTST